MPVRLSVFPYRSCQGLLTIAVGTNARLLQGRSWILHTLVLIRLTVVRVLIIRQIPDTMNTAPNASQDAASEKAKTPTLKVVPTAVENSKEVFEAFRSSLLRCLSSLKFLDTFYAEFMSASHEVREAFAHTDMERQKAMLNASLYQLMNLYERPDEEALQHVAELGALHGSHGLRIPDHLYDLWLESLLVAVSASDPLYDENLEQSWREVMSYGINMMRAHIDDDLEGYAPLHHEEEVEDIQVEDFKGVLRKINQLSKEAAHRSNLEKDTEAMAFQFGQYRAYLHASELLVDLLKKKPAF